MSDRNTILVVGDPPALFGPAFDAVLGDPTLWRASAAEAGARVGDGDEGRVDCVVGAVPPDARAELVRDVRRREPGLPVVLVVDPEEEAGGRAAFDAGATDYLAARGTDEEAAWLAHRVRAAIEAHRSDRERTRRIAQQYVVSDLGAFALSGPTYERLFEETVERLAAALDVPYIAVGRFRPSVGDVELLAVEGWPDSYVGGVSLGPGTHAERTLWADGALVSDRVFLDDRFDSTALEDAANIQSGLSVAIEGRDGPWGVITAHSAEPEMFDETDGRFIENVATLVGAAIERQTLRSTLEEVFERMGQGVYGLDERWRITSANPEAERLLGVEPEDAVGRSVRTLFEDEYVRARYERARYEREPATFEAVYSPTGAWYEHRVYPSQNGVSVYLTDVTERRERELELLRYERMVETADDGVYALDEELRYVEVNRGLTELYGRSREELLGTYVADFVDEETEARADEERKRAVETGEPAAIEYLLERPDGSSVWVETRFTALFETDDGGERRFVGTVGISRDVSARRRRERLLTTLQERTRSLTRVTDYDAAVELTLEACEDLFEPRRADFFEYDPGERTLRPHPASDAGPEELVVPGGHPCWRAFAEEKTVVDSEAGRGRNRVAEAVGQYGVLVVETDGDTVADGSGTEVFRLLASTMSEILSVAEAEAALGDRDRRLESQNDRLTKLNRINRTIREVTGAVVRASTREEAAASACERLVDAPPYRFAWFCEVDAAASAPTPTTTSGVENGYAHRLAEVARTDPFSELLSNAAGSLAPAVVKNVVDAPGWEVHRRDALSYGFQSVAVVPAGEGRLLVVHGTDVDAFDGEDGEMLAELGATLGNVIDRLGRSEAMLADRRTEVELAVTDGRQSLLALARGTGDPVRVTGVVPTADGGYRTFVQTRAGREAVERALPAGTSLTELTDVDDDHLYEMRPPDRASFEVLYAGGGRLREMSATEERCRVVVSLPESVSVRSVVDAFSAVHPGTTLVSKRTVTNPVETDDAFRARLDEAWTERQKEAISAAYHGGFYEWPRRTTATTLSDAFGVSSPTFQYHLRAAERKLVRTAFE